MCDEWIKLRLDNETDCSDSRCDSEDEYSDRYESDNCECEHSYCDIDGIHPPVVCKKCCRCDPYWNDFTCPACEKAWQNYDRLRAAWDLGQYFRARTAQLKYPASCRTLGLTNGDLASRRSLPDENSVLVRLVKPSQGERSAICLGPIELVFGHDFGVRYHGRFGISPVVYADSKTRQWFDLIPQRQLSLKETILLLMSVANRLPDVEPVVMTRMVCMPLIMRLSSLPDDVTSCVMRVLEFA